MDQNAIDRAGFKGPWQGRVLKALLFGAIVGLYLGRWWFS